MAVGRAAEGRGGAGEQLGVGGDLGVHLQADHDLPVAGCALDEIAWPLLCRLLHDMRHAYRFVSSHSRSDGSRHRAPRGTARGLVQFSADCLPRACGADAVRNATDPGRSEADTSTCHDSRLLVIGLAPVCRRSAPRRGAQDLPVCLPGRSQLARPLHPQRDVHAGHPGQRHGRPDQARQGPQDRAGPGRALGNARTDALALPPAQGRHLPRRLAVHRRRVVFSANRVRGPGSQLKTAFPPTPRSRRSTTIRSTSCSPGPTPSCTTSGRPGTSCRRAGRRRTAPPPRSRRPRNP